MAPPPPKNDHDGFFLRNAACFEKEFGRRKAFEQLFFVDLRSFFCSCDAHFWRHYFLRFENFFFVHYDDGDGPEPPKFAQYTAKLLSFSTKEQLVGFLHSKWASTLQVYTASLFIHNVIRQDMDFKFLLITADTYFVRPFFYHGYVPVLNFFFNFLNFVDPAISMPLVSKLAPSRFREYHQTLIMQTYYVVAIKLGLPFNTQAYQFSLEYCLCHSLFCGAVSTPAHLVARCVYSVVARIPTANTPECRKFFKEKVSCCQIVADLFEKITKC